MTNRMPAVQSDKPINGFYGLLQKEILRFWRVIYQTIGAPVLSTFLWMLIFSHVLSARATADPTGGTYAEFLLPGLVMMSVLQNSFANSSSSLIQSKLAGNLLLVILPPISPLAFFGAYITASMVRGCIVGAGVLFCGLFFVPQALPHSPLLILFFALTGAAMAGALGIIAGLWAEKFDQIGLFTNFIIMPLTFLAGVFYSIHSLPPGWRLVSQFNPFLYMIDGFRYGFYGQADINPVVSMLATLAVTIITSWFALHLVRRGYKIKT